MDKLRRKLSWDKSGALEGLPFVLVLLVVITACLIFSAIYVLDITRNPVLWDLDIYVEGIKDEENPVIIVGTYEIYIIAKDDYGQPMKDVDINLRGMGIDINDTTDSNGKADFGSLTFQIEDEGNVIRVRAYHYDTSTKLYRRIRIIPP